MNANSTRNVVVESGGTQVVAHVGLHALGSFADRLGVGERLSSAVGWSGPGVPVHDRGRVLCQAMLMLAGGGESCTDIESLAAQGRLFGDVCSDTTLYRTFTDSLDGDTLVRARQAIGRIRGEVWERIPAVTGGDDPVILDIDASLVEIHSENKDGTAPNFKGGFGFHPMFCFADATGEALAARLRPGNAAANDAADNLEVLDDAITQLPADVAAGHCVDDGLGEVRRRVMVRSDSAGCTAGFVDGCRSRNIGFAVVARRITAVSAAVAVANTDNDRWVPALNQDGTPAQPIHQDDGDDKVAMVCEVTDLVDLSSWPKGTRLIVRREPLHPGAQTSLLPDLEYRFWRPLHRPRRRPRHPGPPDAGPRPRRGPHRPAQRLRPVAVPVHRLRRQRGVASCRVLGSGPGPLVPAALCHRAPRPGAAQTAALATVAHTRPHRS